MPKYGTFANTTEKALALTSSFEGPGNFSNVTGSSDKMGISFGCNQQNLGKMTLQPMLKAMFKEGPATFRKCFTQPVAQYGGKVIDLTDDLLKVCEMSAKDAVAWAEARQDNKHRLQKHWLDAFVALGKVEGFRKIQIRFAQSYLDRAKAYMTEFGFTSERAFCLLYDICIQMGSIGSGAKARYKAAIKPGMSEDQKLLCLAQAMPPQAGESEWIQRDVLIRKTTIAKGGGVVHNTPYNLETDFGVTMTKAVYA